MPTEHSALIRSGLFVGGLAVFLVLELVIPYRIPTVSKPRRWLVNLGITIFNNILMTLIFTTAFVRTISYISAHRTGVSNLVEMPYPVRVFLIIAFMDFMLCVWHLLNHEIPLLWRFHRVHHSDPNMDVSTGTRFHIGELMMSAVIRIALIFFIGADFLSILIYECAVVVATQFHHSSLGVPKWFESVWQIFFVPPSMHRIHHSVIIRERNSNYGVLFSVWDRMFGTLITNTDQDRIRIGVGTYSKEEDRMGFQRLLLMPFEKR